MYRPFMFDNILDSISPYISLLFPFFLGSFFTITRAHTCTHTHTHLTYTHKPNCSRFALLLVLVIIVLIVFSANMVYFAPKKTQIEVLLFGDSLIDKTNTMYQLSINIQTQLNVAHRAFLVTVNPSGKQGNTLNDLMNRMDTDVLQRFTFLSIFTNTPKSPPNALIMYWDSDAADNPTANQPSYISNYKSQLTYVLTQLTSNIEFVAVGGPTLFGEKPRGLNPLDSVFETYTSINRNFTVGKFHLPYLETR